VLEIFSRKLHLAPGMVAAVCDIWSYNPTFLPTSLRTPAEKVNWDPANEWELDEQDDPVDPNLLQRLKKAVRVPKWGKFLAGEFVHLSFDGGAKDGVGSAAFVLVDAKGQEVVRRGLYMGPGTTCNEAEARAVHDGLHELARLQDDGRPALAGYPVRVLGDSQLVIRHLLRLFKASTKPSLYLSLEGTKALVRRRRWAIAYRYVPRELNAAADYMATKVREAGATVEYWDGQLPAGAPVVELGALYSKVDELARGDDGVMHLAGVFGAFAGLFGGTQPTDDTAADWGGDTHVARCGEWALQRMCAVWDRRLEGKPCRHCGGQEHDELMVVCDRCESPYHRECQEGVAPVG